MSGLKWKKIGKGFTRTRSCPRGANGTATRHCDEYRSWLSPNLFECISTGFINVKSKVSSVYKIESSCTREGLIGSDNVL